MLALTFLFATAKAEIHTDSLSAYETYALDLMARDSTVRPKISPFGQEIDRLSSSRLYQMTYAGVPLVVSGLIMKSEDKNFRSLRNDYMPEFRRHADDYLQYAPAAVMLGLKALGVEGRSSWGRMLVSDAFSVALMAALVNTSKCNTHVVRPDGTNDHSFPSGHTATAFMTATMLTKEYGHISPWVGIGAYTVAAGTGLMRMANNKHWLSDVLTGAGIGILSTEVGYYLADLIFKGRGLNPIPADPALDRWHNPSFVSLYIGGNIPLSGYDLDENNSFRTSSGSTAGIEGAYFFSPFVGVGGRLMASHTRVIVNETIAADNSFDTHSLSGGAYFSYPVSTRWLIGTKLLAGYVCYPELDIVGQTIPSRHGVTFGSGVACTFRAKRHYGMRFFLDYNLAPSQSRHTAEWMNTLTFGSSFAITL